MGFGVISSAPCLAGVFVVCSFLFVTIWVAPENRAHEWQDSRLYCFNAGFSGVPNGPYAHVFNKGSDLVHKPAVRENSGTGSEQRHRGAAFFGGPATCNRCR